MREAPIFVAVDVNAESVEGLPRAVCLGVVGLGVNEFRTMPPGSVPVASRKAHRVKGGIQEACEIPSEDKRHLLSMLAQKVYWLRDNAREHDDKHATIHTFLPSNTPWVCELPTQCLAFNIATYPQHLLTHLI